MIARINGSFHSVNRNLNHNLTQPSHKNRYYHNSFTYKASHLWNQLSSYIKRSTELSEYRKHLRSFNLTILRASCKCNFCISQGFTKSAFFFLWVLDLFIRFLDFNLFGGMREGVALSIHGYNIVICFHTFMIFLNYFLFKCIVSLLTYYFYCHVFYT